MSSFHFQLHFEVESLAKIFEGVLRSWVLVFQINIIWNPRGSLFSTCAIFKKTIVLLFVTHLVTVFQMIWIETFHSRYFALRYCLNLVNFLGGTFSHSCLSVKAIFIFDHPFCSKFPFHYFHSHYCCK